MKQQTDKKKVPMSRMELRISVDEKVQIEEKARKTGLSTSEYIRRFEISDIASIRGYSLWKKSRRKEKQEKESNVIEVSDSSWRDKYRKAGG